MAFSDKLGNSQVKFTHEKNACDETQTRSILCYYLISIFVNKNYNAPDTELQYSLSLFFDREPIILKENRPFKNKVSVSEYQYYIFSLLSFESVSAVYFQLTPLTGDPALSTSRFY